MNSPRASAPRRARIKTLLAGAAVTAVATAVVVVSGGDTIAASFAAPPANAKADYQLGGAYPPPSGVRVVSRDRTDDPAAGLYNICYINGFQTQPGDNDWWKDNHDNLLLKDADGDYVVDEDWGEILLDIRTSAKREAIADIVTGWIGGCAGNGFQAVEIDNLDTFDRSDGLIKEKHTLAYAKLLTTAAHDTDLAIAQKNSTGIADVGRETGFDFAVAEECGRYDECGDYVDEYGSNVIVIEYRRSDFNKSCDEFGSQLSIMLRDVPLSTPDSGRYVYDAC